LLVPIAWFILVLEQTWVGQRPAGVKLPVTIGLVCCLLAMVPLPLDSRSAPAMSLAYVLAVCLRPFALLGVWLSLLRVSCAMRARKRSISIETPTALSLST